MSYRIERRPFAHANAIYRPLLQQWIGVSERDLLTLSIPVTTNRGRSGHAYAAVPSSSRRLVIVHSGLGHSFAEDCIWLAELMRHHSAFVYVEPYGHSPFTSPYPPMGGAEVFSDVLRSVYQGGLQPLFNERTATRSKLYSLPLYELGQSAGAAAMVDAHLDGVTAVAIDGVKRPIEAAVWISPRLCMNRNRFGPLTRMALRGLQGFLRETGGSLERFRESTGFMGLPRFGTGRAYGIDPDSPHDKWLQETAARGLRPTSFPWPYLADMFRADADRNHRIHSACDVQLPRVLWALSAHDRMIDPAGVADLALELSGRAVFRSHRVPRGTMDGSLQNMVMKIPAHNPFRPDNLRDMVASIHAFFDEEVRTPCLPMSRDNASYVVRR